MLLANQISVSCRDEGMKGMKLRFHAPFRALAVYQLHINNYRLLILQNLTRHFTDNGPGG